MLAIYTRISVDKEGQTSTQTQKEMGIEFARSKGMTYRVYKDEGVSGGNKIEDRPDFERMINDINEGAITDIYVTNQDRLERSEVVWYTLLDIMLEKGVTLWENGKKVELDDENELLLRGVKTAVNANERRKTSRKIRNKVMRNFAEGKAHGRIPYGYTTDENNKLIPHPEKSKVVERIFNMEADGMSIRSIMTRLNGEEVVFSKHKKRWTKSTISKMLKNKIYVGERSFHDQTVPIPPLISEDLYKKAKRARDKNFNERGKINLDRFYLRGLVWCGTCKNRYLGNNSKYPYYMCTTKRADTSKCDNKNIRATWLEDFIWFLLCWELPKEVQALKENNTGKAELDFRKRVLIDKLSSLDKQVRRHAELSVRGELPMDVLSDLLREIERKRVTTEDELNLVDEQLRSYEVDDMEELSGLGDIYNTSNTFKSKVANKYILKVVVIEEDGMQRLDVHMKVKNIKFSFMIHPHKGFAMNRLNSTLFLMGRIYKKEFNKAKDKSRWFNDDEILRDTHQKILNTSEYYTPMLVRDWTTDEMLPDKYARFTIEI